MTNRDGSATRANARCAESAAQPWPPNNYDGGVDGLHDVDAVGDRQMDAAPAYQLGPLGSHYLHAVSPLFNKGSRTPASASLFQHTTRVDQAKDGEEIEPPLPNQVNIGPHYIATLGATSKVPRDSDSDSIPDYVEDANGNGAADSTELAPPPSPLIQYTRAQNDVFQVQQNSTDNGLAVLVNDSDSQVLPLAIWYPFNTVSTTHGTVRVADDHLSMVYTPNPGFHGVDTLTYAIVNDFNRESSATVNVFVNQTGNHPPVAEDDQRTLNGGDTTITIDVLANDSDLDNDPRTIFSVSKPQLGTVQIVGSAIEYTRPVTVAGLDQFTYTITDGRGGCATGIVRIDSNTSGNHAPISLSYETTAVASLPVNLLLPATDPDGDPLTYAITQQPQHGTFEGDGPNRIYTADPAYYGPEVIVFKANDGGLDSALATILVHVGWLENIPPVAEPQSIVVAQNTTTALSLTGWDYEDDYLTYEMVDPPVHGTLSGDPPQITYTTSGYTGWDSLSFRVSDGKVQSETAAVFIEVRNSNPVPTANRQSVTVAGTSETITLSGSSPGGGALTYTSLSDPLHGSLTGTAPNLVYTPDPGYVNGDYFTFKVNDGNADSSPALVSIRHNVSPVVNAGPDQMAHLSVTLTLVGVATDDGVPTSGGLSYTWNSSGPGTVAFGDAHAVTTTATFSSVGNYTINLTAGDGELSSTDDMAITVRPDGELIIVTQPSDQEAELGGSAIFAVQLSDGGQDVTFEWYHQGNVVGTDNWLEVDPVQADGEYYVVVSDGTTTLTSRTALLTVACDCVPAPDGLIAWWRAEDDGLDNSGLHNATLTGVSFNSGRIDRTFDFDSASDRAAVADHSQFAFTQSFAIEGWVYVNAFSHGFIFVRGNSQSGIYPYYLSIEAGGQLRFYLNSGSDSDQLETPLAQNQWHHVAAVLDDSSGQMTLYVDGAYADGKTTMVRPFASFDVGTQSAVGIGNHPLATVAAAFNGRIDELAVYSSALSASRIALLCNAGAGKCVLRPLRLPAVQFTTSDTRPIPASVTFSVPGFPGAEIYYTLDGQIPTRSTGVVYTGPVALNQPTAIIAFATMQACEDGPTTIQKFGYPADTMRMAGNNQIGVPNEQLLLPFIARITTASGKPVANGEMVTFSARSPSGADIAANLSNSSDTTGSFGYAGLVRTFLALGGETGVYTVTAHYGDQQVTFEAETVTPISILGVDDSYRPLANGGQIIQDPGFVLVSVSGQRQGITHVLGGYLSGDISQDAPVTTMEETSAGSGVFVPMIRPPRPQVPANWGLLNYASADLVTDWNASYWGDSDEFDTRMRSFGVWDCASKGRARSTLVTPPSSETLPGYWPPSLSDPYPFDHSFLKAAGLVQLPTRVLGDSLSVSPVLVVPDQANVFYVSTHGYHGLNALVTKSGDPDFSPADLAGGEWRRGLTYVIIAGCSVLDVTGHKTGSQLAPGRKWATTGPRTFLGYEYKAPVDRYTHRFGGHSDAGPKQVVQQFLFYWENPDSWRPDELYSWMYANRENIGVHDNCRNACAINAWSDPKYVLHLVGTGNTPSVVAVQEDLWAGEP